MRSRYPEVILCAGLALFAAGCQTGRNHPAAVMPVAAEESIRPGLAFRFSPFSTLNDLWHAMVEPSAETGYLQVYEKGDVNLAVCMQPEGGLGDNALVLYTYDTVGKQWHPRVYWRTMVRGVNEVIGVHLLFNPQAGMLEARSGAGRFIFRAALPALGAKQPEELFPGKPGAEYPAFRTLAGLKASAGEDGRLCVFEKGKVKVGIRVQSWGAKGWKGLILYTFDEVANLWSPRAIWDTGAKEVRVRFNKLTGIIEVRSGNGALIFRANIAALEAIPGLFAAKPQSNNRVLPRRTLNTRKDGWRQRAMNHETHQIHEKRARGLLRRFAKGSTFQDRSTDDTDVMSKRVQKGKRS